MPYISHSTGQVIDKVDDVYLDIQVKGDLSSLKWVEMPPKNDGKTDNDDFIYVTHSALNFRDVMLASGRIPIETVPEEASEIYLLTVLLFVVIYCISTILLPIMLI